MCQEAVTLDLQRVDPILDHGHILPTRSCKRSLYVPSVHVAPSRQPFRAPQCSLDKAQTSHGARRALQCPLFAYLCGALCPSPDGCPTSTHPCSAPASLRQFFFPAVLLALSFFMLTPLPGMLSPTFFFFFFDQRNFYSSFRCTLDLTKLHSTPTQPQVRVGHPSLHGSNRTFISSVLSWLG